MNNYAEYILLATHCADCNYNCAGIVTTVRAKDGRFYLCNGSACTEDTQLEITEEIFNSLLQQYIAVNGSTPVTP